MKEVGSNISCPACHGPLQPRVLACGACGVRVEGAFQSNEFATLAAEDLHFLRIFVHCEGRIREMESALGLSYPTIRARLTALKNKLVGELPPESESARESDFSRQVLDQLGAGEISFEEAMEQIRTRKEKPK